MAAVEVVHEVGVRLVAEEPRALAQPEPRREPPQARLVRAAAHDQQAGRGQLGGDQREGAQGHVQALVAAQAAPGHDQRRRLARRRVGQPQPRLVEPADDHGDALRRDAAAHQVVPRRGADHQEVRVPVEPRQRPLGRPDVGGGQRVGLAEDGGPEQVRHDRHHRHLPGVERRVEGDLVDVLHQEVGAPRAQPPAHDRRQRQVRDPPVAGPVHDDAVERLLPRRAGVGGRHELDLVAGRHGPPQDLVQVDLRPAAERIADVAPVDGQDPQDGHLRTGAQADGLRATTPIVMVV